MHLHPKHDPRVHPLQPAYPRHLTVPDPEGVVAVVELVVELERPVQQLPHLLGQLYLGAGLAEHRQTPQVGSVQEVSLRLELGRGRVDHIRRDADCRVCIVPCPRLLARLAPRLIALVGDRLGQPQQDMGPLHICLFALALALGLGHHAESVLVALLCAPGLEAPLPLECLVQHRLHLLILDADVVRRELHLAPPVPSPALARDSPAQPSQPCHAPGRPRGKPRGLHLRILPTTGAISFTPEAARAAAPAPKGGERRRDNAPHSKGDTQPVAAVPCLVGRTGAR
mmetsp:Transcript_66925/g.211908  ORF Transcript_66925/g.211908 Transcript_66925/m.211908 type:complete len:284 (-) Transcript_66925:183-1034(-)